MIIIGVTYLDECVGPTTTTSSIRAGVYWIHIPQSTLESAVFEGFTIYPFDLLNFFYMRIVYLSSGSRQYESASISILGGVNIYVGGSGIALTKRFEGAVI